jgi:hypothetical protein
MPVASFFGEERDRGGRELHLREVDVGHAELPAEGAGERRLVDDLEREHRLPELDLLLLAEAQRLLDVLLGDPGHLLQDLSQELALGHSGQRNCARRSLQNGTSCARGRVGGVPAAPGLAGAAVTAGVTAA